MLQLNSWIFLIDYLINREIFSYYAWLIEHVAKSEWLDNSLPNVTAYLCVYVFF